MTSNIKMEAAPIMVHVKAHASRQDIGYLDIVFDTKIIWSSSYFLSTSSALFLFYILCTFVNCLLSDSSRQRKQKDTVSAKGPFNYKEKIVNVNLSNVPKLTLY